MQHIVHNVEQAGYRLTSPRLQLIETIAALRHQTFTGEQLYNQVKGDGLGRATVFRTLKLLQELGLLLKLHQAHGCNHYIVALPEQKQSTTHQDRLVCRTCGRTDYLKHCPIDDAITHIAKQSGYHIETHHLHVVGICDRCLPS